MLQDIALLALRLIVGAIFLYAGYAKFMFFGPLSEEMAATPGWMVTLMQFLAVVEPLGGIALIAGFLTWWASLGLAIIMAGAVGFLQFLMGSSFFTGPQGTGIDYVVLILVGCIALMAFGPGSWAADAMMKKR